MKGGDVAFWPVATNRGATIFWSLLRAKPTSDALEPEKLGCE
jgi:hypothetical protein